MSLSGYYFGSEDDANDWLAFDAREQEEDDAAYGSPDHHAEWCRWRDAALRREADLDGKEQR